MADGKYKCRIVDGSDGSTKTMTLAHADSTIDSLTIGFAVDSINSALPGGCLVTQVDLATETTVWIQD